MDSSNMFSVANGIFLTSIQSVFAGKSCMCLKKTGGVVKF